MIAYTEWTKNKPWIFCHNCIKYWQIFNVFFTGTFSSKICSKPMIKYPTTPQTRRYATLWTSALECCEGGHL